MNRRDLIKAAPAAGLAGVMGAPVVAATETPIMSMYREWQQLHIILAKRDDGPSDPEWDAMHERTWRLCYQAMSMQSQAPTDFIAKMMMTTCDGEHLLPERDESPLVLVRGPRAGRGCRMTDALVVTSDSLCRNFVEEIDALPRIGV